MIHFDPEILNNPRALRNAYGTFMTGVTVVTTFDNHAEPLGFTANSFTSVSLQPPLVLVCLANTSSNYGAFAHSDKFAVNVLSEEQIDVSNTFARPVEDRFSSVAWQTGPQGSPILEGVSAWFDCSMFKTVNAGDHLILIGEVKAFDHNISPGLCYSRGAYATPAAEVEVLSQRTGLVVSALIERDGRVLLVDDGSDKLCLPQTDEVTDGASTALRKLLENTGVSAESGFIYSVYQDDARGHQHISFLCHAADGSPRTGLFLELNGSTLDAIADPAMRVMLERFGKESRQGNFGVYHGNEKSGEVKPLT